MDNISERPPCNAPESAPSGTRALAGRVIFSCFLIIGVLPLIGGVITGCDRLGLTLANMLMLYCFYRGYAWACLLMPVLALAGAVLQLIAGVPDGDPFAIGYGLLLLWMFLAILFSRSLDTYLEQARRLSR